MMQRKLNWSGQKRIYGRPLKKRDCEKISMIPDIKIDAKPPVYFPGVLLHCGVTDYYRYAHREFIKSPSYI